MTTGLAGPMADVIDSVVRMYAISEGVTESEARRRVAGHLGYQEPAGMENFRKEMAKAQRRRADAGAGAGGCTPAFLVGNPPLLHSADAATPRTGRSLAEMIADGAKHRTAAVDPPSDVNMFRPGPRPTPGEPDMFTAASGSVAGDPDPVQSNPWTGLA